jgi:transcriptional regulator with XRE-family HTH domain
MRSAIISRLIHRAYVSGLELGQRNPTIVTLWHLAQALQMKLRQLFEEERGARANRTSR